MTDDPGSDDAAPAGPPARRHRRIALILAIGVALLLGWGAYGHWRSYARSRDVQRQAEDYVPSVRVAAAELDGGPVTVSLPGETQAFDFATIFARATGYIAERRADIGSRVKAGDLLVRISAPDLDAQLQQAQAQLDQSRAALSQAQAQLAQSQANVGLAQATNRRTTALAGRGYASKQDADNAQANVSVQSSNVAAAQAAVQVAEANIEAQTATVQRLQQLTAFERVTAPFDGIVTARNVDVGDLVNADQGGGTAMFTVMNDDVLRISVQVPQSEAMALQDGMGAEISVPEIADRKFQGRVARSSVALASTSRTLLVQVDVPNADHALRPGLFVFVAFHVPRPRPRVVVPDQALIFDADGQRVAVVTPDDRVRMQKVSVDRDLGTASELRDGLDGGERLVLSPPTDLADGSRVKVSGEQRVGSRDP